MTDLSGVREQAVLEDIQTGGVYVSLHNADEGNTPDGGSEVAAADYGRQFVPEADITITGGSPTVLSHTTVISWGVTESDWGDITHSALWSTEQDAAGEEPYTTTMEVENGGNAPEGIEVKINEGDLTFEID